MKRISLSLLVLLTFSCKKTMSMQENKESALLRQGGVNPAASAEALREGRELLRREGQAAQETEQIVQAFGPFQISENWNDAYKGLRFKLIAYQLLAHQLTKQLKNTKMQLNNTIDEKQVVLAELNQSHLDHEQTRIKLSTYQKLITKATQELNQRKLKIDDLQETVARLNEQLIQAQQDFGH